MRHSFAYAFVMFVVVSLCVGQNTLASYRQRPSSPAAARGEQDADCF